MDTMTALYGHLPLLDHDHASTPSYTRLIQLQDMDSDPTQAGIHYGYAAERKGKMQECPV